MGDLPWRGKKGGTLGCRRGWARFLGFAAFVIVGYVALYGWLRWNGEIRFATWGKDNEPTKYLAVEGWSLIIPYKGSPAMRPQVYYAGRDGPGGSSNNSPLKNWHTVCG